MDGMNMYNKALVADDEKDICEFLKKILSRRGYSVATAFDGACAKKILEEDDLNLIFLDYDIPGTSGFDLVKLAREKNPEAVIAVFTGHHSIDRRIADDLGANFFLQKPLSVKAIEDIIGGIE